MSPRSPMSVRFWGVRGSIPAPGAQTARYGGNTPCIEVRCGEHMIILDAGTGIPAARERAHAQRVDHRRGGILFTLSYGSHQRPSCRFFLRLSRRVNRLRLWAGKIRCRPTVSRRWFVTALVGLAAGPAAVAGFGTASRLEYLLVPLVFGLGGPLVALVGTNIGAGNRERALQVAWTGAAIAFVLCETIGIAAALYPTAWLSLFDPIRA